MKLSNAFNGKFIYSINGGFRKMMVENVEHVIGMFDLGLIPILGHLQMVANDGFSSKPCLIIGRYKAIVAKLQYLHRCGGNSSQLTQSMAASLC